MSPVPRIKPMTLRGTIPQSTQTERWKSAGLRITMLAPTLTPDPCPRSPGRSAPHLLRVDISLEFPFVGQISANTYNDLVIIQRSRGSWPGDAPPTDREARWHSQVR